MNHPYKKYESTKLWNAIWESIEELSSNQDIEEMTAREYIVGFLCEKLISIEKKV